MCENVVIFSDRHERERAIAAMRAAVRAERAVARSCESQVDRDEHRQNANIVESIMRRISASAPKN